MADDLPQHPSHPDEGEGPPPSAAAEFTAMMRQAAQRAAAVEETAAPAVKRKAAPETRRIRRVRRREAQSRTGRSALNVMLRTLFAVLFSTGLVATLLTWFTDPQFLNPAVVQGLYASSTADAAAAATVAATPNWLRRIGVISGHRGQDSGAICEDDGLREADINFEVARRVVASLRAENYAVDLLDENDARLNNYRAVLLVSIHANTCQDFGEYVSGYLVAKAGSRPDDGADATLVECIALNYETLIPLPRGLNLTIDMTDYHVWHKIHPLTPGAIIEMGYMLADREILTELPDLLAQSITNGVRCFLALAKGYPRSAADGRAGYLLPLPTPVSP